MFMENKVSARKIFVKHSKGYKWLFLLFVPKGTNQQEAHSAIQ